MFKCDITLFAKPQPLQSGRQEGQPWSPSKNSTKSCYVLAADYQFAFFDDENKEPFYKINTGGLSSHLDADSQSLTLSKRKGECPLAIICSDTATLEKLSNYCKEFSDESILWSPLVYRPSSSSQAPSSKQEKRLLNFKGVLLLCLIMVFYSKLQDVVHNIHTYGLLPMGFNEPFRPSIIYYPVIWIITSTSLMMAFEKLAFKKIISNNTAGFLETINMVTAYLLPVYYVRNHKPAAFFASLYVFWSLMMIMKMISYMHFMHNVRKILPRVEAYQQKRDDTPKESIKRFISKQNLEIVLQNLDNPSKLVNVKDILHLYFFPTLIYQLWFPRTSKIDWGVVRSLSIRLFISSILSFFWTNQFLLPALREAAQTYRTGSFAEKFESLLTVTNSFAVLMPLNTYLILHLFPYLLAEITRFDDRDFYQDWWNSPRIRTFWSRWNRLVHKWCQRHIYYPLLRKGYSKIIGLTAVFLFSSIMHEYLLSIPFRIFACYAMGLMTQVPIIMIELKFDSFFERFSKQGFAVWAALGLMLCPLAMIQYHVKHFEIHEASNFL